MGSYSPAAYFAYLRSGSNYAPPRRKPWADRERELERHRRAAWLAERSAIEAAGISEALRRGREGLPPVEPGPGTARPAPPQRPLKPAERPTGGYQPPLAVSARLAAAEVSPQRRLTYHDVVYLIGVVTRGDRRYGFNRSRMAALIATLAGTGKPMTEVLKMDVLDLLELRVDEELGKHISWWVYQRGKRLPPRSGPAFCSTAGKRTDDRSARRGIIAATREAGWDGVKTAELRRCFENGVRERGRRKVPTRPPKHRPRT